MNNNTRTNCIFSTHNLSLLYVTKVGQSMEIAFQTEISSTWCGETLESKLGNGTVIIVFQLTALLGQCLGAQLNAVRVACGFPLADNAAPLVSVHRIVQHRRGDRGTHESSCNWNIIVCFYRIVCSQCFSWDKFKVFAKGPLGFPWGLLGTAIVKLARQRSTGLWSPQILLNS